MSEFSLSQNKIIDDMKSFILCWHIDLRTCFDGQFCRNLYYKAHKDVDINLLCRTRRKVVLNLDVSVFDMTS